MFMDLQLRALELSRPLSGYAGRSALEGLTQNTLKEIIIVPKPGLRGKARAITSEEKDFDAYQNHEEGTQ